MMLQPYTKRKSKKEEETKPVGTPGSVFCYGPVEREARSHRRHGKFVK